MKSRIRKRTCRFGLGLRDRAAAGIILFSVAAVLLGWIWFAEGTVCKRLQTSALTGGATVVFESDAVSDSFLLMPPAVIGAEEGREIPDPLPAGELLNTSIDGKNYVLVGWTTEQDEKTHHVWNEKTAKGAADVFARYTGKYSGKFYYYDGGTPAYTANASDADEYGVVRLYAVWAVDENGNGVPDFDEAERYNVYFNMISPGKLTGGMPKNLTDRLKGTAVVMPGRTEEGYQYSVEVTDERGETTKYLAAGWTTQSSEELLFKGAPVLDASERFFPVGEEFRLGEGEFVGEEDELNPDRYFLNLYVVWTADREPNGGSSGDGIPDYLQNYTLLQSNRAGGTCSDLPAAQTGLKAQTAANTHRGSSLSLAGEQYALVGWTAEQSENYVFSQKDGLPADMIAAGAPFTMDVRYAERDGDDWVIRLYAVWGIDTNRNGIPDWEDETCTVSYETESGKSVAGQTVLSGSEIVLSSELVGEHAAHNSGSYTFLGWTEEFAESYFFDVMPEIKVLAAGAEYTVTESVTFHAVWVVDNDLDGTPDYEQKYTVKFVNPDNNETLYVINGLAVDSIVTLLEGLTFDVSGNRYTLLGWVLDKPDSCLLAHLPEVKYLTENYTLSAKDAEAGNVTLYALWGIDKDRNGTPDWEDETCTVSYETGNGKSVAGQTVLNGTEIVLSSELVGAHAAQGAEHYIFLGWTEKFAESYFFGIEPKIKVLAAGAEYTVTKDVTFHAVWVVDNDLDGMPDYEQKFKVTFVNPHNGATLYVINGLAANSIVTLLDGLTFDAGGNHYTLLGWVLDKPADCLFTHLPEAEYLTENYTLSAKDAEAGSINLYALWGIDKDRNGTPDWADKTYAVSYEVESGKSVAGQTVLSGTEIALSSELVGVHAAQGAEHYIFLGWTAEFAESYFFDVMPEIKLLSAGAEYTVTESVTFHAVWVVDNDLDGTPDYEQKYTVKFVNPHNGVTLYSINGLAVDSIVTLLEGLTFDVSGNRYTLLGWVLEKPADCLFAHLPEAEYLTENYTLSAKDAEAGVVSLYALWGIDKDRNSTPDWADKTYAVSYETGNGKSVAGQTVLSGSEIVLSSELMSEHAMQGAEHYIFLGWTAEFAESYFFDVEPVFTVLSAGSEYTVTEDVTFHAVWVVDDDLDGMPDYEQKYTVKFINPDNGATLYTINGLAVDSIVTLFDGLTFDAGGNHYTLLGWVLDKPADCLFAYLPEAEYLTETYTLSVKDATEGTVTLYALWGIDKDRSGTPDWEDETCTVSYEAGNGKSVAGQTVLSGAEIVLSSELVGEHAAHNSGSYTFLGWTEEFAESYFFGTKPVVTILSAGAEYTVTEDVTFHAVWVVDNDLDGAPDYEQKYTVKFVNPHNGATLYTINGLAVDSIVTLLKNETYDFGDRYILLGWTLQEPDDCFFTHLPEAEYLTEAYTLSAKDATEGTVTLYALWGIDENENGFPDWADRVLVFADLLGYAEELPSERRYAAGESLPLPDVRARGNAWVIFLGWTADQELAGKVALTAEGLYTANYPVPAEAEGILKLYAVWGVTAGVEDRTFGDRAERRYFATRDEVDGTFLLERIGDTGERERILLAGGKGLYAALGEALLSGLNAGEWSLYACDRVLDVFTVSPRVLRVTGIAALDKEYDGSADAELVFSDFGWLEGFRAAVKSSRARFEDAEAGERKRVYVELELEGEDAGNLIPEEIVLFADIAKSHNEWLVEFGGEEAPVAKYGSPTVEYFRDASCTQKLEGELSEQSGGVYYAHVTVAESANVCGLEGVYAVVVEETPLAFYLGAVILAQFCLLGVAVAVAVKRRL